MSDNPPEHLLGTNQHQQAKDLSKYLVHMTCSAKSLAEIVISGQVEARNRFGMGRTLDMVAAEHQSACFTEMPLNELDRLRDRGKSWGIAFKKEFIEEKGGQRIWYLGSDSTPFVALKSMKDSAIAAKDWKDPIWRVTPFVDNVDRGKYAFDWEREWRIVGGLQFDLSDVIMLIGLEGVDPLFHEEFSLGAPLYDPRDDSYVWHGETIPSLGANLEAVLEKFHREYQTPDEARLSYSTEPEAVDGYWWLGCATRYETEDALADLLPDAPTEVHNVLSAHLNGISPSWALRDEFSEDHERGEGNDGSVAFGTVL
ncbi:hypothetical protein QMQ05_05855 [Glutamicibacter ectropisis]|uniref:DUF4262 domain-containing protein n=1 Tax=Glutamicibacter ectropisis TaxID=3046593 RepID=A0AAU6WHM0_9MICC